MTTSNQILSGKTALITGAASPRGIGFTAAKEMALSGATVVMTDVAKYREELEQRANEIKSLGGHPFASTCDITKEKQVTQLMAWVSDQCDGIDILFNNAGIGLIKPFDESTLEDFELNYQVNLLGTVAMTKAVVPSMKVRGGGSIINNASVGGIYADAFFSAYNASKFAVVGFTKCLALELGEYNIRVNAICPGFTDTDMADQMPAFYAERLSCSLDQARQKCYEAIALKRPAQPEEVADLVVYLASSKSSYLTGAAIPLTGGFPQAL